MKFFKHTVRLDGKRLPLLRVCLKCCCGEVFESIETNPAKGLQDAMKKAELHVSECAGYALMREAEMRRLSMEKVREILLNS